MSPNQMREVIGEPAEIVIVGSRKTWRYPNVDVVFASDRLETVTLRDPAKIPSP